MIIKFFRAFFLLYFKQAFLFVYLSLTFQIAVGAERAHAADFLQDQADAVQSVAAARATSGAPVRIGVPATFPWHQPGGRGAFQRLVMTRIPGRVVDAGGLKARLQFVPLSPDQLDRRLSSGYLDGAIATELSGISKSGRKVASLGTINFGFGCLRMAAAQTGCIRKEHPKIAFWGSSDMVRAVAADLTAVTVEKTETIEQGIEKLNSGTIDAVFGEQFSVMSTLNELSDPPHIFQSAINSPVYLWVRKDEPAGALAPLISGIASKPISQFELDQYARDVAALEIDTGFTIGTPLFARIEEKQAKLQTAYFALFRQFDQINNTVSNITRLPFQRAVSFLELGTIDFHWPLIETDRLGRLNPNFRYVGPSFYKVEFVVFLKDPDVFDPETRTFRDGSVVVTDTVHAPLLGDGFLSETCLECAALALESDHIDALVFAAHVDSLFENARDIEEVPFKTYDVRGIAMAEDVDRVDRWLRNGVTMARRSGLLKEFEAQFRDYYVFPDE